MREGPAAKVVRELIAKFPDAPARTLARRAYASHPKLWRDLDGCRTMVRQKLGVQGKRMRTLVSDKSKFRKPRQAGWSEVIPAALEQYGDWKPFEIPGKNRTLSLSDVHIPYHSEEALELALEYGEKRKPTLILLNGDVSDHYMMSNFERDPRERDFPMEVRDMKFFLRGLRKRFPKARIIYKHGNHEERYERFMIHKCPEFLGIEEFEWANVFGLKDAKVELIKDKVPIRLGSLNVLHGHEYQAGLTAPVSPARGMFLRAKSHVLCGHSHQSSQHSARTVEQKVISVWSTGSLCNLHPRWKPLNEWNHGFAFIETGADGSFHVDNMRIVGGTVY